MVDGDNSWEAWRRLVLKALEENADKTDKLGEKVDKLSEGMHALDKDITELKTSSRIFSSVFGAIAGAVTSLIGGLLLLFFSNRGW